MQLARKLTLPLAVCAFIALGMSGWLSAQEAVARHHGDLERDQGIAGRVFLSALDRLRAQGGLTDEEVTSLLDAANRDTQRALFRLVPRADVLPFLAEAQRDALLRGEVVFVVDVWKSAETWLPTTLPDGQPGVLWVQENLEAERAVVRRIVTSQVINFVVLGALWALVAIGLGAAVVGRPMRALAEKARRVSEGDYSGPLSIQQDDEIGQLAREMNHMCDELVAARERIEREVQARLNAQAALRHADRLTTVGVLAAGLAHEFGTPLNVVSMRAKLIATGEVTGEEALSNARIIGEQAQQMTRIIRQVLDFARRTTPTTERIELGPLVEKVLSLLTPLAEKSSVQLRSETGPTLVVHVDRGLIQQVLTNLVLNAVQAMPSGGVVTLGLERVRATPPADLGGREGDYARLTVSDEGPGVPPDVLPRLFEPFFTTKPIGDGTGLGLPVAWGIIRDHRGWIDVASPPGKGATFAIYLPLEPSA
jgi:signal transduction histidine kinase